MGNHSVSGGHLKACKKTGTDSGQSFVQAYSCIPDMQLGTFVHPHVVILEMLTAISLAYKNTFICCLTAGGCP